MPKPVLLVEPDEALRPLLAAALRGRGFTVIEAADEDALYLRATALRPSVIVLSDDIAPTNGGDVVRRLREGWLANVPVVLLSTGFSEIDVTALQPGVVAVLLKPFHTQALIAALEEHAPVKR